MSGLIRNVLQIRPHHTYDLPEYMVSSKNMVIFIVTTCENLRFHMLDINEIYILGCASIFLHKMDLI
jgi:hypothetical protein